MEPFEELTIDVAEEYMGNVIEKLGQRKASILAKLSVFAVYQKNNGTITDVRIAVGAVNDLPIRLPEAEKALVKTADVDAYLETLSAQLSASDDRRSTKDYREKTALKLVKHFLDEIFEKGGTD